jgi:hypothetical protein
MAKAPNGKSAVERLKALDEERSRLVDDAKSEAMERANEAISALNALGFSYRLTQSGDAGPGRRISSGQESRKGTRQVNAERPCPICGFRTEPPHDARRHRGQDPKRPFTDEELKANNMRRV